MTTIKSILKRFFPIIIITLLVGYLFGNTLFPPDGKMLYGGDIYDAYYFWKGYLKDSFGQGIIPFWNPYNFSGTPFLAHPNINIFYPPNWLFIFLPQTRSFAFYFFLHQVIAGVTMYWLARQFTDKFGAITAGIIYALGGFFAARVYSGHPEYIDTASWLPLAFGLSRRALLMPSSRNILFSILGMSVLLFSGNELFFLFFLELIFLYLIYLLIRKIKSKVILVSEGTHRKVRSEAHPGSDWDSGRSASCRIARMTLVLVILVVLAFGLAAVEFLPRFEFLKQSLRSEGVSYGLAGSGSMKLSTLQLFIQPFFYGGPTNYAGPWPNLSEYTYYVGVLPILLILLYLIYSILKLIPSDVIPGPPAGGDRNPDRSLIKSGMTDKLSVQDDTSKINPDIWFFLLLVIPIFLLISLGTNITPNIHEFLWRFTPFYKSIRFPARHLLVVAFSLSLITGILIGGIRNKLFKMAIIVLITLDLLNVSKNFYLLTDLPTATFDQNLISSLQADKSLFRLLPDFTVISPARRQLDFGAATKYKIQTTSDYNSMVLKDYYHFIDVANKSPIPSVDQFNVEIPPLNPSSPFIDFLNIRYVLADRNFDAIAGGKLAEYKLLSEGSTYRLYENLIYLPRFFLVGEAKVYPSDKKLDEALIWENIDLSKTIVFTKEDYKDLNLDLSCGQLNRGKIEVTYYEINKIILVSDSPCNNILSSSEVFYPGWKAKIDGRPTKIYRSNIAFRSLYVPQGKHQVEFYFRPDSFYLGGAISLLSVAILIYLYKKRPDIV